MDFEKMGKYQLRDANYLIGGIFVFFIGIVFLLFPEAIVHPLGLPDLTYKLLFGLSIPIFLTSAVIIYCAFLGSAQRYFLDKDGKCVILKGIYCSFGDCRKCTFSYTYLKKKMVVTEETVIIQLDDE